MNKRKKDIIEKINENDKRIQKQKEENLKQINNKLLEKAMKEEDVSDSLEMFELQMEFQKKKKIKEMKERDKRLEQLQNDKIRINLMKKKLNEDLENRKLILKKKVDNILSNRTFYKKEDIYKKVFNEDELSEIQKNSPQDNETEYSYQVSKRKENENKKINNINEQNKENNNEDDDFFLTQG
jgi:hypothetical protein